MTSSLLSIAFLIFLTLVINLCHQSQALRLSNTTDHLALLPLKPQLPSWDDDGLVFCRWPGVACDAPLHPGRVTYLNLSTLGIRGAVPPSLANLTFLRTLDLSYNGFGGRIPPELGRLRRLRHLDLSHNSLEGDIPGDLLSGCAALEIANLGNNMLRGTIPFPSNMSRWSNLRVLVLKGNMLTGGIPPELASIPGLVMLSLRDNNLTGSIPPHIGNLSFLSALFLSNNQMGGTIPAEIGRIPSLRILDLMFNRFSGPIPPSLYYNLSNLFTLGLGSNNFSGTLPSNFGLMLPSLVYLYLYQNHFSGTIPSTLSNASSLEFIELSENSFIGSVPSNLGAIPNLSKLLLGGNKLEAGGRGGDGWGFVDSLTNCTHLKELDLSSNMFTGPLPQSITDLTTLEWLRLRNNTLTGSIPEGVGRLSNLTNLDMENNRLSGPIPASIGNIKKLQALILDSNLLSGELPPSIGDLTQLVELYLNGNNFTGRVPESFVALRKVEVMDLSHNSFSETVPKGMFSPSISIFLNLSHNSFVGTLPEEVGNLMNLRALDVSHNTFSGNIPSSLGKCLLLDYLNMGGNEFDGTIPNYLSNLKGLQFLDLSKNHLSGQIPEFLGTSLPLLKYLNLSYNDFDGEVSMEGIFSTNPASISVTGNSNLCGGNSVFNLKSCSWKKKRKLSSAVMAILIVSAVVCFCLAITLICLLIRRKHLFYREGSVNFNHRHFDDPWADRFKKVSYSDLHNATDGFSSANLIGTGASGSVYRGTLGSKEEKVAVKVLNHQLRQASKSFMAECKALRNTRHRNLVRVITSCSTVDSSGDEFKAIVCEYMPNGNLEVWLHGGSGSTSPDLKARDLGLVQRLTIAADVASALDYLHNSTETPIVHCDLKPGNVLLDEDMTAHVSDFGIARFLSQEMETTSIGIKGTFGYIAPECGSGGIASTSWDVYSYGILLLEMFTGRRPTHEAFINGFNLHKFAQERFPAQIWEIVDPRLIPHEKAGREEIERVRNVIISIIETALACSRESPRERLRMEDVVKKVEIIKDSINSQFCPAKI